MSETVQTRNPSVGASKTRREYTPPTSAVTPLDVAVRFSAGSVPEAFGGFRPS
jgi:hypothetical protein